MNKIYKDKEFMSVASPILSHKEFLKTKSIVHHGNTRYNHSVRVSYTAFKLSKMLGFDTNAVIRAGALHDFFLVRDDKNIMTSTKMLIDHPKMAKENNIIESHMFPISNIAPKSKEAWMVSLSDKIVAAFEGVARAKAQIGVWMVFLVNFIR